MTVKIKLKQLTPNGSAFSHEILELRPDFCSLSASDSGTQTSINKMSNRATTVANAMTRFSL